MLTTARTVVVTLKDATEVIVQLKDNEITLTRVGLVQSLRRRCARCAGKRSSFRIYGDACAWHGLETSQGQDPHVASQIGRLIAASSLSIDSSAANQRRHDLSWNTGANREPAWQDSN